MTADGEADWHRVHPASPAIRGWIAILAVMVIFGRNSLEELIRGIASGRGAGISLDWVPLATFGGAIVVYGVFFVLSWIFTRYQVTETHVRITSGVLIRQQRQARIDRLQAIDLVQPLLARIFNLAELKFEVADGGKSVMRLSFLTLGHAQRLRAAILARAAGVSLEAGDDAEIPEAPEQEVLRVPPGRIIASSVASAPTVIMLGFLGFLVWCLTQGWWPAVVALLPGLLGLGSTYWQRFVKDFNFRVAISPDGIRLHYGLLETRAQTIPPGRIQAVRVQQNLLWRPFGWYRLQVNVAGYGHHGRENGSMLLPVGTAQDALAVLALVLPDPGVQASAGEGDASSEGSPEAVFLAGMRGHGSAQGFVTSPRRAAWLNPLAWRRNGYRSTETALLCRHGVLHRQLAVVPHERTQSLQLNQGPVQRLLRVADFHLHSTTGPVRPLVPHLDLAVARELFTAQAGRAAVARRIARPERWMEMRED